MSTVLITGIAGSLARLTAARLRSLGHEVIGVDYRRRPAALPPDIAFYRANYNKTRIEDVFRRHEPDAVLHLGRVGNLKMQMNKRFDLNVIGSAKVFEMCVKYKVRRLVVLSTFHIYGAHPHNHIPISEEEPLRAATVFPQIADAVQLDNQALTWTYRHRKLRTVVLRPCNVVGPHINNAISRYLRQPALIYVLGFNPMWQFVHEDDMVQALQLAFEGDEVGVFNVAGAGGIPIVDALELTGARVVPIPGSAISLYLKAASNLFPTFPTYLLDFFRYPAVISDAKLREAFGYAPSRGIVESIESCVHRS